MTLADKLTIQNHLWHAIPPEEVLGILETKIERGLTETQILTRRKIFGKNELAQERLPSRLQVFFNQLISPLILILLVAGFITLFLQEYTDSIVILGAVLLNAGIGYMQEYRATKAMAALKKIIKVKAQVLRNGISKEVFQEELLPGDIIFLHPGDKVPADTRMLFANKLHINEAVLTGEWIPSLKFVKPLEQTTSLADRENMAYMGSIVEEGAGKAVVVATGKNTELGKIASLVNEIEEEKTPYQIRLTRFSNAIAVGITFLAFLIFIAGIAKGESFIEIFTTAIAVAVGAIPEGLPVAVTVILALGMQKILAKKGLARRLTSAETLGSASIIATDKTLTLTEGRMAVETILVLNGANRELVLQGAALANEAFVENPGAVFEQWIIRGRPTDKALLQAALDGGIAKPKLEERFPLLERLPFNSETRYIASFHKNKGSIHTFISGAPESLLDISAVSQKEKAVIQEHITKLANKGLRVVGIGFKDSKSKPKEVKNIRFIGLIALKDPIRKGVKEAIALTKKAGIRTIMVTGDHLLTAQAVAKEIGIPHEQQYAVQGSTVNTWTDEELQSRIQDISIFARVEPVHKMRIVAAWQAAGHVIAMTGDGVNDAPALRKADLGIALGSATDVAKETSDLVLLEDNFAIIPAAIEEGRIIVENIRKVITYLLSSTFTETILIGISVLAGLPLPVVATQILWINLVGDTLPSIALTFEQGSKDVMKRKPEAKHAPLLTPAMKVIIFVIGIVTDFMLLGIFLWLLHTSSYSLEHIRTFVFVGLGIGSILYVFSCKDLHKNIWEYNIFSNKNLVLAVFASFALLALTVYLPVLQTLFATVPLQAMDWALLFGLGLINTLFIETVKWYFIRKERTA
jgi:P-type Ca2+ transporter type 2C